jgi:hypothetical protein
MTTRIRMEMRRTMMIHVVHSERFHSFAHSPLSHLHCQLTPPVATCPRSERMHISQQFHKSIIANTAWEQIVLGHVGIKKRRCGRVNGRGGGGGGEEVTCKTSERKVR